MRTVLIAALLCLAALGAWLFVSRGNSSLREDLRGFITPTEVGGKAFSLDTANEDALRVAYTAVLTRLDPLFGLEGTNPEKLKQSIEVLEESLQSFSASPSYKDDERAILREHFFPSVFLRAVATAEAARQLFLTAPSAEAARNYYKRLLVAIDADLAYVKGLQDLYATHKEFIDAAGGNFTFIGGTSNASLYTAAFAAYRADVETAKIEVERRAKCLEEFSSSCPSLTAALATLTTPHAADAAAPIIPPNISDNQKLMLSFLRTHAGGPAETPPIVALPASPCFTNAPVAYYQPWEISSGGANTFSLNYIRDLYFYDTKVFSSPHVSAEAKKLPYLYLASANLYMCAEGGEDLTTARMLITLREELADRANLTEAEQGIVSAELLFGPQVQAYLESLKTPFNLQSEAALAKSAGTSSVLFAERLLSIAHQRSSHFDTLVHDVVANNGLIESLDRQHATLGVVTLFLSRSYPALLLLSYNQSVTHEPMHLLKPGTFNPAAFKLASYNSTLAPKFTPAQTLQLMLRWETLQRQATSQ